MRNRGLQKHDSGSPPPRTATAGQAGHRVFASAVLASALFVVTLLLLAARPTAQLTVTRFPADRTREVNPDTHLVLTFPSAPMLGKSGQIRIYDAADNRLVDTLDLSIPPGPTTGAAGPAAPYTPTPYEYTAAHPTNATTMPGTPSGAALPTSPDYQLTIIGGFSDGFHFYPVIVHDTSATIYPHHNLLQYDKTYYVQIDPGAITLADGSFTGISGTSGWRFTTKRRPPAASAARVVVSADDDRRNVVGATVYDTMPDAGHAHAVVAGAEPAGEEVEGSGYVTNRFAQVLLVEGLMIAAMGGETRRGADAFDLASNLERPRTPRRDLEHRELQAR